MQVSCREPSTSLFCARSLRKFFSCKKLMQFCQVSFDIPIGFIDNRTYTFIKSLPCIILCRRHIGPHIDANLLCQGNTLVLIPKTDWFRSARRMMSSQFFLGPPGLCFVLFDSQYMACFGSLLLSIRKTCASNRSLLSLMVRSNVCSVAWLPHFVLCPSMRCPVSVVGTCGVPHPISKVQEILRLCYLTTTRNLGSMGNLHLSMLENINANDFLSQGLGVSVSVIPCDVGMDMDRCGFPIDPKKSLYLLGISNCLAVTNNK